jgi:hypothetical protein
VFHAFLPKGIVMRPAGSAKRAKPWPATASHRSPAPLPIEPACVVAWIARSANTVAVSGYGIDAAGMKGVTFKDTFQGEVCAPHHTVSLNGFEGVLRTGGPKSARGAHQGRYKQLIGLYQRNGDDAE